MSGRFAAENLLRISALVFLSLSLVTWMFMDGLGQSAGGGPDYHVVDPVVDQIWEMADGPIARNEANRAWTWGPEPISVTTEYYADSPTGARTMVYFDKGRLDVLNPERAPTDPWYTAGGLLVSEMLAGQVQLGANTFAERATPEIPVAGDINQGNAVTYAVLARYASASPNQAQPSAGVLSAADEGVVEPAVDKPVTTKLNADGTLALNAASDPAAVIGEYDPVTRHNIVEPFLDWGRAQPQTTLYLLGHPLSEPYWIETAVGGTPKLMLIQAFERRILTYVPGNDPGWQVESANVGLHYRAWRELSATEDPTLLSLASGEPFGEQIVSEAQANGLDPFMLAAVGRVISGGNPFAMSAGGGRGLLGVHVEAGVSLQDTRPLDPTANIQAGARALAEWAPDGEGEFDWRAVLANYFSNGQPNWDDPALGDFVFNVLETYGALEQQYPPVQPEPDPAVLAAEQAEQAEPSQPVVIPTVDFNGRLSYGPAAYYDPSYSTAWWERTLRYYESIGLIKPGWANDPNGYYCVRPGYIPGHQLQLRANGVTITCTIGDMVADRDLHNWLYVSGWSVELNWDAFTALGLDRYNYVEVDYPGESPHALPPVPPPATPEPEPTETPSPTPEPTQEPTPSPTPEPTEPTAPAPGAGIPAIPVDPTEEAPAEATATDRKSVV